MTKQQIIQRLGKIKEDIMFPSCPEDFTPIHRLGRVGKQLIDLIGDIEVDTEPISHGPEVPCGPPEKQQNGNDFIADVGRRSFFINPKKWNLFRWWYAYFLWFLIWCGLINLIVWVFS